MTLFLNTFFTCFLYYIIGRPYTNLKSSFSNCCLLVINGAIILSFIAVFINFFFKLSEITNTILFLLLIVFSFYKIPFKKIINNKSLISILLISLFATVIIYLADNNRPDSGLYHFPFIKLLNDEKLIIGITNINSRFGTISIIQYLQAISNNVITNTNGMLLPLSILPSAIYLYFFNEINIQIKKKVKNKPFLLFIFFSLIFFTYKMNRYGQYGNDYIPHFFVFFLVSILLKYNNKISFSNIYFYSVFIFLNKIIFFPIFFFALLKLKENFKFYYLFNFKNFLISGFLVLWVLKTLLNSGCLFWPFQNSCINKLSWFNSDESSIQHVSRLANTNKAWAKAWPDKKEGYETQEEYISGYKWIKVWASNHGKKVFKIISIYAVFLILIIYGLKKNIKQNLEEKTHKSQKKRLITYLIFFSLCSILWFFYFPVFRFGISYLVLMLIFAFTLVNHKLVLESKNINLIKYISIFCITVFISKNMIKLENYNQKYNNYPWPKYYDFDDKNLEIKLYKKKVNNKFSHYYTQGLCMYSKSPCTNENVSKSLSLGNIFSYKIYYF